jgi:signal-transduction protein with cAMP-binding, CBS, and nucleotidyltransferase domain
MVVITKDNKACGVLTKFDIMSHLREKIGSGETLATKDERKQKAEKAKLGA